MKVHAGVAQRMFNVLPDGKINIHNRDRWTSHIMIVVPEGCHLVADPGKAVVQTPG